MPGLAETLKQIREAELHLESYQCAVFTPLMFEAFLGKDITSLGFEDSLCFGLLPT